jgi:hypothetical protein
MVSREKRERDVITTREYWDLSRWINIYRWIKLLFLREEKKKRARALFSSRRFRMFAILFHFQQLADPDAPTSPKSGCTYSDYNPKCASRSND